MDHRHDECRIRHPEALRNRREHASSDRQWHCLSGCVRNTEQVRRKNIGHDRRDSRPRGFLSTPRPPRRIRSSTQFASLSFSGAPGFLLTRTLQKTVWCSLQFCDGLIALCCQGFSSARGSEAPTLGYMWYMQRQGLHPASALLKTIQIVRARHPNRQIRPRSRSR